MVRQQIGRDAACVVSTEADEMGVGGQYEPAETGGGRCGVVVCDATRSRIAEGRGGVLGWSCGSGVGVRGGSGAHHGGNGGDACMECPLSARVDFRCIINSCRREPTVVGENQQL